MNELPKLSIVIPTYNTEKRFIRRAINSCQEQTMKSLEIVVVDDGSTMDVVSSILDILRDDVRVRYERLPENLGVSAARNAGLESARGEYVRFLDSDDWLEESVSAKQIEFLESNPQYAGCYVSGCFVDEYGSNCEPHVIPSVEGDKILEVLLRGNFLLTHSVVLRRQVLRECGIMFDTSLKTMEDWDFWLTVFRNGLKIVPMHYMGVFTARRQGSLSGNATVMYKNYIEVFRRHSEWAMSKMSPWNRSVACLYIGSSGFCNNDFDVAWGYYRKAVATNPLVVFSKTHMVFWYRLFDKK